MAYGRLSHGAAYPFALLRDVNNSELDISQA
jgi:hypothetical protein